MIKYTKDCIKLMEKNLGTHQQATKNSAVTEAK